MNLLKYLIFTQYLSPIRQKLYISQKQMSNYVTGESYPPVDKTFELAKITDCRVYDLYEVQEKAPAD
ncbi:transcriptional regulator [Bacillus toyonensis]|nr:transcriptional regulator [Bacillus toyonensis]